MSYCTESVLVSTLNEADKLEYKYLVPMFDYWQYKISLISAEYICVSAFETVMIPPSVAV
jgi:hypothetical protein